MCKNLPVIAWTITAQSSGYESPASWFEAGLPVSAFRDRRPPCPDYQLVAD